MYFATKSHMYMYIYFKKLHQGKIQPKWMLTIYNNGCDFVFNPRRACVMWVTVLVLCVCVSVTPG